MHQTMQARISRRGLFKSSLVAGTLAAAPEFVRSPRRGAAEQATSSPSGVLVAHSAQRGTLVSVSPLAQPDATEVTAQLQAIGLDASRVRFGVSAARIVYGTIDPAGQPTTASALVALPANGDPAPQPAAWLHGTMVYRGDAASVAAESPDRAIAFALAAAGYATVAPDYLGLGEGPGFHPYNHTPSAVSASLDALRAAHAFAAEGSRRLDGRVLVTGFSKGGRVTMALGRALQEGADPAFGLAALAPIGGPFDFSGTLRAGLAGEINAAPKYLAYLVVAWNRIHRLYDDPAEAFRPPYAATVEAIFDGEHTDQEVFAGLPAPTPGDLFTPGFVAHLRTPTGALARALAEADGTVDWSPRVPVDLFAARGDRDVPIANAEHAVRELRARGAAVRLTDVGDVDHTTSVVLSLPRVLARFDEIGGEG